MAVSGLLAPDDHVLSNHRGHGHYLARLRRPARDSSPRSWAGRARCATASAAASTSTGGIPSTGVQGESLPVAAGLALHLQPPPAGRAGLRLHRRRHLGRGRGLRGAEPGRAVATCRCWSWSSTTASPSRRRPNAHMAGTIAGRAAGFGSGPHADHRRPTRPRSGRSWRRWSLACASDAAVDRRVRTPRLGPHSKGDDTRPAEHVAGAWPTGIRRLAAAATDP